MATSVYTRGRPERGASARVPVSSIMRMILLCAFTDMRDAWRAMGLLPVFMKASMYLYLRCSLWLPFFHFKARFFSRLGRGLGALAGMLWLVSVLLDGAASFRHGYRHRGYS